ncbi:MAG: ribonuclease D [Planctomycetota bacterium]|nr:MAG: ribonuclease D [Planctomycetota bacterium]
MSPTPTAPTAPPTLVVDPNGLNALLRELDGAAEIAVDTEADSFFSYRERVCLIQISARGRDWIVDPFAELDLAPLGAVFADPARLKVFHDAEFDILILHRELGFRFRGLFDTRIAAAALGNKSPGLATVLNEHFGVELDKSLQRSDWSQRPLTPQQIAYARLDTHFLERLMAQQLELLRAREREHIVREEMLRLERLESQPRETGPDDAFAIKGARTLSPLGLRALRELFAWREQEAERRNVPPFKVCNNDQLLELARGMPNHPRMLTAPGMLYGRQAGQYGSAVLAAITRAREAGPLASDPFPSYSDDERRVFDERGELTDRLKQWRKVEAEKLELDSALVLNRHALEAIAERRLATPEAVRALESVLPWQAASYAEGIAGVVAKFESDLASGKLDFKSRRRR